MKTWFLLIVAGNDFFILMFGLIGFLKDGKIEVFFEIGVLVVEGEESDLFLDFEGGQMG